MSCLDFSFLVCSKKCQRSKIHQESSRLGAVELDLLADKARDHKQTKSMNNWSEVLSIECLLLSPNNWECLPMASWVLTNTLPHLCWHRYFCLEAPVLPSAHVRTLVYVTLVPPAFVRASLRSAVPDNSSSWSHSFGIFFLKKELLSSAYTISS